MRVLAPEKFWEDWLVESPGEPHVYGRRAAINQLCLPRAHPHRNARTAGDTPGLALPSLHPSSGDTSALVNPASPPGEIPL